jgi:hypothetical protein
MAMSPLHEDRHLFWISAVASADRKWLLLDSKLLEGECILLVFEKRWLAEARQAYPGTVIYFPPEVEALKRVKDAPVTIKFLHRIKKEFGAWIVPSNRERAGR